MVFGNGSNNSMSEQQSLASLSELNDLLESALRMSGDDAASMLGNLSSATATYPPPAPATNTTIADDSSSESTSTSWRLDTTRKLTAVSID